MNRRKTIVARAAAVLLVLLAVCTLVSSTVYNLTLPRVSAVRVERGLVSRSAETQGELFVEGTAEVKAAGAWRVREVLVSEGEAVSEGTPLFALDVDEYLLSEKQLELERLRVQNRLSDTADGKTRRELNVQLEILDLQRKLLREKYPTDGLVTAPAAGRVRGLTLSAGDRMAEGQRLCELAPEDGRWMLRFALPRQEGLIYETENSVSFALDVTVTDPQSGNPAVSRRKAWARIESRRAAEDGGWEYAASVRLAEGTPISGQVLALTVTNPGVPQEAVVPLSCLYGDISAVPWAYVVSERQGLFGIESYVTRQTVSVLYVNETHAALESEGGVFRGMRLVEQATAPLLDGDTVWMG